MAAMVICDGIEGTDHVMGSPQEGRTLRRSVFNKFPSDMYPRCGACNHTIGNGELRILVVEDDYSNQKVAKFMLQRLGYNPDVVANGLEALEAVKALNYDIVFMNVQMPVMDGLETTRKIRQDLPKAHQPYIIALTAYVLPGSREMCLKAGMDNYLAKPVSMEDLQEALRKCKASRPPLDG